MITQLILSNFKSIRQQSVTLGRTAIFIGQNGAGKSNFSSIFVFLAQLARKELASYIDREGGFDEVIYGGLAVNSNMAVGVVINDENHLQPIKEYGCFLRAVGTSYRIARENLFLPEEAVSWTGTAGGQETELRSDYEPFKAAALSIIAYFKTLRVYHFQNTSDNARLKLPQDISNSYFLQSEGENLAPFLYNLYINYPAAYAEIVAAVQLIYPAFTDFFLQESSAKNKIELKWRERGNEAILHARQLSDGTLRFICLATLLLQPPELPDAPRTLVLDEPELGLHPFALHVLAELLHKAAVHRQVIVATQSVGLLNYFMPEDLLIVERGPEGDTTFIRKTSEELREWLQDYSLGQLWEANLLGGRP